MGVDVKTGSAQLLSKPRFQYLERIAWIRNGSGLVAIGQEQDSSFQQIWYVPYPTGEPKHIGNDLNDYSGISAAGDGRSLVSVQTQTLSNVYVLDPDNRSRQITPGSGRYFDLAWTPQGRLVYASDASGSADIWIMNADGSGQHQLTSGKGRSYSPAVSPDSRYVAYHSNRTGAWNVWRMGIDGSSPEMLTSDTRDSNWPQFTPDGHFIVYHHTEPNAMFTIWKVPTEGGTPVRMTSKLTMRPAVAFDGRIACWYSEQSGSPNWKLAVFPPHGGSPVALFDPPPSASPDTSLRWNSRADGITLTVSRNGVANLYEQRLSGGPARPLTRFTSGQIYSFDWSRSGQLAYSRGISSSDVVLIRDARNE
jgi:Tol biopolymer transport system component